MQKMTFVLRKFRGSLDAGLVATGGRPMAFRAAHAPSLLGVAVLFAFVMLVPLIALGAIALLLHGHAHSAFALATAVPAVDGKKVLEEMKSTFEQFKEYNEKRETELKTLRTETGETKSALEKTNAALDGLELKFNRMRTAAGIQKIDDEILEAREQRSVEQRTFLKWARRGPGRLKDDEVKSLSSLKYVDADTAELKALDTDSDVEGGVFVPHQLANRVIQKLILVSPFRSITSVEPISTGALEIPAEGATNFAGGWVGERAARPQTTAASLRMERVPVHEMYAEPAVSQTQLDDSVFDVETWLSGRVATILAQIEGLAFIKGTGVQQPEGVAGNVAIPAGQKLSIANATFTANTTAQGADMLLTMWSTLPTFYANEAAWILNRLTLGTIRKFKDNNNQYLWAPAGFGMGLTNGFPATILGQPYAEMPDMASIGAAAIPLMLGNFRKGYQIADRIGIRVIRDNLTAKPFVIFYTTKRVGGQVVLGEAMVQLTTT